MKYMVVSNVFIDVMEVWNIGKSSLKNMYIVFYFGWNCTVTAIIKDRNMGFSNFQSHKKNIPTNFSWNRRLERKCTLLYILLYRRTYFRWKKIESTDIRNSLGKSVAYLSETIFQSSISKITHKLDTFSSNLRFFSIHWCISIDLQ